MAPTSIFTALGSSVFLVAGLGPGTAQTLDVNVGFAATMKMERKIHRVIVDDPSIARANIVAGKVVVVVGKAEGVTDIVPLDDKGAKITVIVVKVTPYRPISDLLDASY